MDCRVTKTKRYRISYPYRKNYHDAVDITDIAGTTPVLCWLTAHSDGQVVEVVDNVKGTTGSGLGNYIRISHTNGYETLYAHIAYNSIKVKKFDFVKAGQDIGYMGATGGAKGGHLHFEVRKDGKKIDPTPFLTEAFPQAPALKVGDIVKLKDGVKYDVNGKAMNVNYLKKQTLKISTMNNNVVMLVNAKDGSPEVFVKVNELELVDNTIKVGDIVKLKTFTDANGTKLNRLYLSLQKLEVKSITNGNVLLKNAKKGWDECIVRIDQVEKV